MRKRGISDLPTHSDVYLTVPAFAEHLNVPDKTVWKWLHAGVLTAYRFQSEWRISKTDAVLFVEGVRFRREAVRGCCSLGVTSHSALQSEQYQWSWILSPRIVC